MGLLDPPALTAIQAAKQFQRSGLPANAGGRSNPYEPSRQLYNFKGPNSFALKAKLAAALSGTSLTTLLFIGDSKTAGFGINSGASIIGSQTMPGRIRTQLGARGYPIAGTGVVPCSQNVASGQGDTRWVFGPNWTAGGANVHFRSSSTSGASTTFTSDVAGTVVEIYSLSNSGPFSYSIDGAAAVTVTPSGTNVIHKTTVTGLPDTTHTVVIATTSTTQTYILGANVRKALGVQISNLGIAGSTSSQWNDSNFFQSRQFSKFVDADHVFFSMGTNDARGNVAVATYKNNLSTLIQQHTALGRTAAIIVQSPVVSTQVPLARWDDYVAAQYDLADTLDIPLIDLSALYGTYAAALAKGLFYDDLHENAVGYATNALSVIAAISN